MLNCVNFEIDINYPDAILNIWKEGTGKGIGKGGKKHHRDTYKFIAEKNYFSPLDDRYEQQFQSFYLLDTKIEIFAKNEKDPYVSFEHNISLDSI